ncbi:hypothetical protein [Gaetbulibacter sp. PBL-D1]|uniref:hypothetical protein n=1 Tax=Gaetbulibacter sp. PBL-D1 TaxID=3422594 RepID=UPI003D2ED196
MLILRYFGVLLFICSFSLQAQTKVHIEDKESNYNEDQERRRELNKLINNSYGQLSKDYENYKNSKLNNSNSSIEDLRAFIENAKIYKRKIESNSEAIAYCNELMEIDKKYAGKYTKIHNPCQPYSNEASTKYILGDISLAEFRIKQLEKEQGKND